MGRNIAITDLDIIYLSFDEPKADAFFADLQGKCPNAKRIHGIKGFDAAHKAAAEISQGDHFITVDADNIVDPAFFGLRLDEGWFTPKTLISWPARNAVNGLVYGNGALKIWPRRFVLEMQTHELAQDHQGAVDFVYNNDLSLSSGPFHIDMPIAMSTVHANTTPFMAFRSGFRAALRLTLVEGYPSLNDLDTDGIDPSDLHRLLMWLNVGADAPNGLWTIFGARLGCAMGNYGRFELRQLNDLDWFRRFWERRLKLAFMIDCETDIEKLRRACAQLGRLLRKRTRLAVIELSPDASRLVKRHYTPPPLTSFDRMGNMFRRGIGVEPDPHMARACYQASTALGHGSGMRNLAHHLITSRECGRDYAKATALLREAAANHNPYGLQRLAQMHLEGFGWGIDKDPQQALALLERAADLGFREAAQQAASMHKEGSAGRIDPARAALLMAFAAFDDRELIEQALTLQQEAGKSS